MIICFTVPVIWHLTDIIVIFHFSLCTKNFDDMICSSWGRVWQIKVGNHGSCFAHLPSPTDFLKVWKIRILKKRKKLLEITTFYTCVLKTTIIWVTVPEKESEADKPENQNFEKIRKVSEDVSILHLCTKNHNHMIYASWDTECDRQFFVILCHFLPFYPTIDPEI